MSSAQGAEVLGRVSFRRGELWDQASAILAGTIGDSRFGHPRLILRGQALRSLGLDLFPIPASF